MTTLLALGKVGDILGVLPIALHHFRTTGVKPNFIVSQEYASLLDRVPFVQRQVYNGPWTDLQGALKFGKQKFGTVTALSTFGNGFQIEHRRISFQLDAYDRGGMLKQWDSLPLEGLDRGEPKRFKNPTILFADHSQSSPFLQKNHLCGLLEDKFPMHDIVRLSEHRVANFVDFLPWYDGAEALVTIETSHLHLSAATKTPVFALTTDQPSRWHGSCWSKRFKFHCRYSEYDRRKDELVESIRGAIQNEPGLEMVELN